MQRHDKKHLNYSRTVALDGIYTAYKVFIRINSQAHMSRVQARIQATQNDLLAPVNAIMQTGFVFSLL